MNMEATGGCKTTKKSYFVENIEVSISVADILEVALDKSLSALRATPSVLRLYLTSVVYRMQQVSVRHKSTGYFCQLLALASVCRFVKETCVF